MVLVVRSQVKIAVEERAGITIVRVLENITFSNTAELKDALDDVALKAPGGVILDLEEVSFINSTGIGIIASLFNNLKKRNVKLVLLKPRPEVSRVLKIIGFDAMMPVATEEQTALEYFS